MRLTHKCEHGTFTVELDLGEFKLSLPMADTSVLIAAAMPRCPYCDYEFQAPVLKAVAR